MINAYITLQMVESGISPCGVGYTD